MSSKIAERMRLGLLSILAPTTWEAEKGIPGACPG